PTFLSFAFLFRYSSAHHRYLHSFPTRRSSDLLVEGGGHDLASHRPLHVGHFLGALVDQQDDEEGVGVVGGDGVRDVLQEHSLAGDRKSTRLNSSHRTISYAVFCLKKKKNTKTT